MTESVQAARTEAEVREVVRRIVVELSPEPTEAVGPETSLREQLAYNSLAAIELAFTLEDEFDLAPIEQADAQQLTTVGGIEDHVVAELASRGLIAAAS